MAPKTDTPTRTSAGGSGGRKPPGRSTRVSAAGNGGAGSGGTKPPASGAPPYGSDEYPKNGAAFPLLVSEVDFTEGTAPASRSGGGDGYGGGSAGATVSAAIRDVLGYRTRTTDAKGFVSALQRSFTCFEKTGYTVCEWTPRSYAATIPADLGALTGAQASIYERAKISANAILPLLNGLTPLGSTADVEDTDAIRSIVRSRIVEIVNELRLEGGPRTHRVDELFERLVGEGFEPGDPSSGVGGDLGRLRDRFDMDRDNVNTIAEEENFTNFLIIVDNVVTLFISWDLVREFFERVITPTSGQEAPFLGTQLVLLSRQLNVVVETVNECYFVMDSVFLGPAERQTVLLPLEDEEGARTVMFLSELLDWIDRFSTEEGPHLIEEAGTDGVNAFRPTVERLAALALSAAGLKTTSPNTAQIPPSFFTRRVELALQQLASQLARTQVLAAQVIDRTAVDSRSESKQGGER